MIRGLDELEQKQKNRFLIHTNHNVYRLFSSFYLFAFFAFIGFFYVIDQQLLILMTEPTCGGFRHILLLHDIIIMIEVTDLKINNTQYKIKTQYIIGYS